MNEEPEKNVHNFGPRNSTPKNFSNGAIQKFNKALRTKSSTATLFATVKNKIKVCNLTVQQRGG